MEFFRAYAQPSFPQSDHFRVFGLDVASEVNIEYSKGLKDACKAMAGPKPPRPTHCPRCGVVNAIFTSNVCYKAGVAGAWNMICMSCHKVHFPRQPGPTADALEQIEAIRARDHEAYMERKAKKAKQRAKSRAKPPKEDDDDKSRDLVAAHSPFGILNNASDLPNADSLHLAGASKNMARAVKEEITSVRCLPRNYHMKGVQGNANEDKGTQEDLRTVELVFWAENQEPFIQRVPVQFEYELFLYEFPFFKSMRGVCAFERYSFEDSLWCDLPWNTSPIHVTPEDDVIFIRSWGVRCLGFGHQLDRYQRMHGLALSPAQGIRATVDIPPPRHHWLVVWGPYRTVPEMHLVDLSIVAGLDDDARLTLPWAHLISDAPFLLIWRETETSWAAVGDGISSGVLEAPLTLVAHPCAESLMGSGEAIAWLEDWRLGGGPRSRAATPTDARLAQSSRAGPSSAGVKVSVPHNHGERRGAVLPVVKEARGQSKDLRVTESVSSVLQGNMDTRDRRASVTSDELELQTGSKRLAYEVPPAPMVARVTRNEGMRNESQRGSNLGGAHAFQNPGSTTPTEDVEIGDGARLSPLVALVTKQTVVVSEVLANMSDVDTRKRQASPTPDSDVVMVNGLHEQHQLVPCGPSRDVAPMPDRLASPASDSDVEIVEGPEAAPPNAPASAAERERLPCQDRDLAHAPQAPASPASDNDVEIVQGPQASSRVDPIRKDKHLECESHAGAGGEDAFERLASVDDKGDVLIVDGVHARKADSAANDKIAGATKGKGSPASDNDVEILEGPQIPPPVRPVTKDEALNPNTRSAAGDMSTKRPAPSTSDDDIILIDQPSAKLKRAFKKKKKARSSAPGPSRVNGSRTHASDDEVEFVDNASVVPKRRVSNVNGRQIVNLT